MVLDESGKGMVSSCSEPFLSTRVVLKPLFSLKTPLIPWELIYRPGFVCILRGSFNCQRALHYGIRIVLYWSLMGWKWPW